MANHQETSPWVYVGIGCLVIVGLLVIGGGMAAFFSYRWVQQTRQAMSDPEARRERVQELLGTDSLPAGYHPGFVLSLPFIADVALLTDKPTGEKSDPDFDERGFVFASIRDFGDQRRKLRDFVEGRTEALDNIQMDIDLNIDRADRLADGTFSVTNGLASFAAYSGSVRNFGRRRNGVATLISIECETDDRLKLAMWFEANPEEPTADPDAGESTVSGERAERDYTGTPADPATVQAFLANFKVCRDGT